jgi:hypothetical protein
MFFRPPLPRSRVVGQFDCGGSIRSSFSITLANSRHCSAASAPLLLQFFDPTGRAALIVNRIGKGSCETHGKRLRI